MYPKDQVKTELERKKDALYDMAEKATKGQISQYTLQIFIKGLFSK